MINGKTVVTLCGSSRFKDEFDEVNKSLTLLGNVVISLGMFIRDKENVLSEKMLRL